MKSERICAYVAGKKKVFFTEARNMVDGDLAVITDMRMGDLNGCLLARKDGQFSVVNATTDHSQYFDNIFVELVGDDDYIGFYNKIGPLKLKLVGFPV